MPSDPEWNFRHDLLQIMLQQNELHAVSAVEDVLANPEASSLILLGELKEPHEAFWKRALHFIDNGGRILMAVDEINADGLAVVEKGPVFVEKREDEFLRFRDCILIRRITQTHPLTQSLSSIATNRTGWIAQRTTELEWQNLLTLPTQVIPFEARNRPIVIIGTSPRSLLEEEKGGGIILLSDPSILANGMIWYHDNGHFATRIANWLSEGERTHYALVTANSILNDYPIDILEDLEFAGDDPKNSRPPSPKLETLLEVANAALLEASQAEVINRTLQKQPKDLSRRHHANLVWTLLAIPFVIAILWPLLRRGTEYLGSGRSSHATTARKLLHDSLPRDLQNKIAAETIAREFSRRWTGHEADSEWRRALDEIKDIPQSKLPPHDRVQAESILAIAVFGGRSAMSDAELENLGYWVHTLLSQYR